MSLKCYWNLHMVQEFKLIWHLILCLANVFEVGKIIGISSFCWYAYGLLSICLRTVTTTTLWFNSSLHHLQRISHINRHNLLLQDIHILPLRNICHHQLPCDFIMNIWSLILGATMKSLETPPQYLIQCHTIM